MNVLNFEKALYEKRDREFAERTILDPAFVAAALKHDTGAVSKLVDRLMEDDRHVC